MRFCPRGARLRPGKEGESSPPNPHLSIPDAGAFSHEHGLMFPIIETDGHFVHTKKIKTKLTPFYPHLNVV